MATLIEELSLRTSKIQPLLKKLRAISEKMTDLQGQLRQSQDEPDAFDPEDLMVMREELTGLRSLAKTRLLQNCRIIAAKRQYTCKRPSLFGSFLPFSPQRAA